MTVIGHYQCTWCSAALGTDHVESCMVAKGPVKRWQCSVVEVVPAADYRGAVGALKKIAADTGEYPGGGRDEWSEADAFDRVRDIARDALAALGDQ